MTNAAYQQGIDAFRAGHPDTANPYPMRVGESPDRIAWFDGWYDEKHDIRYGRLFSENGLLTMKQERQQA